MRPLSCSIGAVFLFLLLPTQSVAQTVPFSAFPGAEGFGSQAKGGRGGQVIMVTTLADSGTGSLRACAMTSGPRTCIFRTGGIIPLSSDLIITSPFLTIAGQTAPGGGITITGGTISIRTNDVILQYLRSRSSFDGINIIGTTAYNIMIDHVSVSWGQDENMSTYTTAGSATTKNITIQWSLLSEGLLSHSKGLLLGNSTDVSVHHTLFAHNEERNPRCQRGNIDVVNNVIYNYGTSNGWCDSAHGAVQINYIGNFTKKGSNSGDVAELRADSGVSVFAQGNIGPHRTSDSADQWAVIGGSGHTKVNSKFSFPAITTTTAQEAYTAVLAQAGASKILTATGTLVSRRDPIDTRIIAEVTNGNGAQTSTAGSIPTLDPGTPYPDSDTDGMSDTWEQTTFQNLAQTASGDSDNDGYTNLEEFLQATNPAGNTPLSTATLPPGPPTATLPPSQITVTPSPTPTTSPLCTVKSQGDADCDGRIKFADFNLWRREYYGELQSLHGDFNADMLVSLRDYEIWRRGCFAIGTCAVNPLFPTPTP